MRAAHILVSLALAACASATHAPPPAPAPPLASAPPLAPSPALASATTAASAPAPAPASTETPSADPPLLSSLPGISEDGKRIAVWAHYSDGARGEAKSALLLLSTERDVPFVRVPIDDPNATSTDANERQSRLLSAEAMLTKEKWKPLAALDLVDDKNVPARQQGVGASAPKMATSSRVSLTFREPLLTVELDKKVVLKKRFTTWSDTPHHNASDFESFQCPAAAADIAEVYADPDARAALVVIRYKGGTDTCWEPDETYHAVRF